MTVEMMRSEWKDFKEVLATKFHEFTVREDYSGRGMDGNTCFGFVTSDPHGLLYALGMTAQITGMDIFDPCCIAVDAMGMDKIIYWRDLTIVEDEEE